MAIDPGFLVKVGVKRAVKRFFNQCFEFKQVTCCSLGSRTQLPVVTRKIISAPGHFSATAVAKFRCHFAWHRRAPIS